MSYMPLAAALGLRAKTSRIDAIGHCSMILRHTCFLATLCSIVAWAPPQTAQQPRPCRLRAAQLDADAYPPAPWSFSNARVMYQPTLVRTSAARAVTPRDGLTLLSFLGWTLGGVFVVDWTESPVGPYREVAVLSGLVARGLSGAAWVTPRIIVVGLAHRLSKPYESGYRCDGQRWWRASCLRSTYGAGRCRVQDRRGIGQRRLAPRRPTGMGRALELADARHRLFLV